MVGKITCKDGEGDAMEAVFADMAAACKDESGLEIYSYHRGDDNTYWFFALMTDQEAMKGHGRVRIGDGCPTRDARDDTGRRQRIRPVVPRRSTGFQI